MTLTLFPASLSGEVTPPPSKSESHRLLLAAALCEGTSVLTDIADSEDVACTRRAVEELGAVSTFHENRITLRGIGRGIRPPRETSALPQIDCGESGSTLRFLIPVVSALCGGGLLKGHGRLFERPLEPYFHIFGEKGISYEQRDDSLLISGFLTPGQFSLPGGVSSQFITGLLFALPLLPGDSEIILTDELQSRDYITMTVHILNRFSVRVFWDSPRHFTIPGRQHYSPCDASATRDWSAAAFWLAAEGIGHAVETRGLDLHSDQGDRAFLPLHEQIRAGEVRLSVRDVPDLFPPLAVQGALTPGAHLVLCDAERLRLKESDRLSAVGEELNRLGAHVREGRDFLEIRGTERLEGGVTADAHNDHRIAMMIAVAALRCRKPIVLPGAECVRKSYPKFWEDYKALGGIVR